MPSWKYKVCHHRKSDEDILSLASFADRQLEYDTHYIMSFLAGKDVFALPTGYGKSLWYALSRSFLITCIDCKEISAVAS